MPFVALSAGETIRSHGTRRRLGSALSCSALLSAAISACGPEQIPSSGGREHDESLDSSSEDRGQATDDSAGDDDPARPVVDTPWCRALAVLRTHCQSCHGDERQAGAPMSLTRYEHLIAPAVTEPDKKVYELVAARVRDHADPMPPQGVLEDDALLVLDAWLGEGHPAGADPACVGLEVDAGTLPEFEQEPWPDDCETIHTIRAYDPDDPTKPFRIPAGKEVQVALRVDPLPWAGEPVQALAFRPVVDNIKVLHHWNLLEGEADAEPGALLWGFAPGNQGSPEIPDDVGLFLPQGPINLEMHYYNVGNSEDALDRSGLQICTTRTFRKHTAAITKHFNAFPYLLPKQRGSSTEVCRVLTTTEEDIHVLAIIPHMHKLGVHAFMSITHGLEERVVLDLPYHFDDQRVHPVNDVVIQSGDVVKTRCTWENTTDQFVDYGMSSDKEMCANFAIYWPMDGFFCLGI